MFIPRNHRIGWAIADAEAGPFDKFHDSGAKADIAGGPNRAMSHTLLEDRLILLAVRAGPFVQPVDGDRVGWLCPSKTVNERMFLRPTANNFWRLGG
jgi:hypothetical protein